MTSDRRIRALRARHGAWIGRRGLLVLLAGLLLVTACEETASDEPYVEFVGGGFVFNYRLAEAYWGFLVRVKRAPPEGTVFVAHFEDPAGGPPLVVRDYFHNTRYGYKFDSPPLQGIEAGRDYEVVLRLIDASGSREIASYRKTFRSDLDQELLPDHPLTVGPGYQPYRRQN